MGLVRLVHSQKIQNWILSWFTVKVSLVGGIIYYTVQQGIWSKHDESLKLYKKIKKNMFTYVPSEAISEVSAMPRVTDLENYVKIYWNKGVIATIGFIQNQPPKLLQISKDSLVELVKKEWPHSSENKSAE